MLLSTEELLDTAVLLSEELSLDELCGALESDWLEEDSLGALLLDASSLEPNELVDEMALLDDWLLSELLLPPQAARSPLRAIISPSLGIFMLFPLVDSGWSGDEHLSDPNEYIIFAFLLWSF